MNRTEALHILGLEDDATADDIKIAYRETVQILHPDKFAGNEKLQNRATEQFKRLQEAYDLLTSGSGGGRSARAGRSSRSGASSGPATSSGAARAWTEVEDGVEVEYLTEAEIKARLAGIAAARAQLVAQRSAMRYDRDGDGHYDILSALQKSVRGSDPDAALHYLARLLEAGDLISACRRILVIAAEDVGLAYPQAMPIVKACVDSANMLGLPEARIPLAEAVLLLATAPKSDSAISGIDAAAEDVRAGRSGDIPAHLMDSHYSGAQKLGRGLTYQYPHAYPNHYVKQQYLPDPLVGRQYYR